MIKCIVFGMLGVITLLATVLCILFENALLNIPMWILVVLLVMSFLLIYKSYRLLKSGGYLK